MTEPSTTRPDFAPRIFVEPSSYAVKNIGDTVMLAVVLERIRARWAQARIRVHGMLPCDLGPLDSRASSIDPRGSRAWSADTMLLVRAASVRRPFQHVLERCRAFRQKHPDTMRRIARAVLRLKGLPPGLADAYLENLRECDVAVLTGGGTLNDVYKRQSMVVLETLGLAAASGAITAVVGHGFGPMHDPALRRRAAAVLPLVDFIAVRERVSSLPLLHSLGVPPDRITVTGDDGIAFAWSRRPERIGNAIGVNVRDARYSEIPPSVLAAVARAVTEAASNSDAPVVGLPISRYSDEDDRGTLRKMFGDSLDPPDVAMPAHFMSLLSRCRVVVTGSYHVAVFALSTGLPAVTMARSEYYRNKFRGLTDMFGPACRVEELRGPDLEGRLRRAIDNAIETADEARRDLLDAAERQIALSARAFDRLASLVEGRESTHGPR